jgi:hypothetical protein
VPPPIDPTDSIVYKELKEKTHASNSPTKAVVFSSISDGRRAEKGAVSVEPSSTKLLQQPASSQLAHLVAEASGTNPDDARIPPSVFCTCNDAVSLI